MGPCAILACAAACIAPLHRLDAHRMPTGVSSRSQSVHTAAASGAAAAAVPLAPRLPEAPRRNPLRCSKRCLDRGRVPACMPADGSHGIAVAVSSALGAASSRR